MFTNNCARSTWCAVTAVKNRRPAFANESAARAGGGREATTAGRELAVPRCAPAVTISAGVATSGSRNDPRRAGEVCRRRLVRGKAGGAQPGVAGSDFLQGCGSGKFRRLAAAANSGPSVGQSRQSIPGFSKAADHCSARRLRDRASRPLPWKQALPVWPKLSDGFGAGALSVGFPATRWLAL